MKSIALAIALFIALVPGQAQEEASPAHSQEKSAAISPQEPALSVPSDRGLKKDILPLRDALEKVSRLEGVTFRWRDEKMNTASGRVMGMIAQDVEKVIPGWVKEDPDGYLRLETTGMDALLVEAIKEQQKLIEEQKRQLLELRRMVDLLVAKGDEAD